MTEPLSPARLLEPRAEQIVSDACDALLDKFVERAAPAIRKATDSIYQTLLDSVQDYLKENANWNLSQEIEQCRRTYAENIALRTERDKLAEALRSARSLLGSPDNANDRFRQVIAKIDAALGKSK